MKATDFLSQIDEISRIPHKIGCLGFPNISFEGQLIVIKMLTGYQHMMEQLNQYASEAPIEYLESLNTDITPDEVLFSFVYRGVKFIIIREPYAVHRAKPDPLLKVSYDNVCNKLNQLELENHKLLSELDKLKREYPLTEGQATQMFNHKSK